MTRTDHRLGENFKKNHPNTGQKPSKIDRKQFDKDRRAYWKQEYENNKQQTPPPAETPVPKTPCAPNKEGSGS